ncbi:TonB-dependent receptor [Marinifilum sp. JC120]|nr:TonB-dependent receptor [Marinifilum sp. JC120]
MKHRSPLWLITLTLALLLSCPAHVLAEEQKKAVTLTPVKVTAQKREENVQDIPASVDVITSQSIEDAGMHNMEDLYLYTPNVYRSGSFVEHSFVIRGITTFMSSLTPNAPMYVDDVPLPLHYAHNLDLMDVERVEILKGPQGTLYGMNSEAGVFNVITQKPDNETRTRVFGEYGTANTSRLGGYTSFPIIEDNLYLRMAVQQDQTDGHVTNIYDDNDKANKKLHRNLRGTLRWTPDEAWDVSLIADYLKTDDNIMDVRATEGDLAVAGYLESDYGHDLFSIQEGNGINLTAKHTGDNFDFLSVSGFRGYTNHYSQDVDCSSSPIYYYGETDAKYDSKIFSQELRLTSPEDSKTFKWVVGLYGYHEELKILMTDYMLRNGPNPINYMNNKIKKDGVALFGEGTYTLFDDLHITAGLRFAYDIFDGKVHDATDLDLKETLETFETLPKFSVAYDITDNVMTYGSITRGFLSGGYNYSNARDMKTYTYDPEYTWNYEVGIKSSWFDNRLTANLAAFYIQIQDKQVMSWDPGTNAFEVLNAAEAHSKGFELELNARPAQGWQVFGSVGVTEAKIDKLTLPEAAGGTFDYKNKRLPDVPTYTYNLGTQYNHITGFYGRVDLHGIGDFTGDLKNQSKEDGYSLVNVKVGKEWEMGSVYVWCNNIFDTKYHKSVFAWDMTGTGTDRQAIDGDPRTIGIGASLTF